MRHLWSLIAGIVVAPLAWGLLAVGQVGATSTAEAWAKANAFDTGDLIKPAIYLAAAGILLGLIATLRISPLGSMVAAVLYLGVNVGLFIDPFATRDAIPDDLKINGQLIPLRAPVFNGTLLTAGVLLVIAIASVGRWRAWPAAVGAGAVAGDVVTEPADESATAPAYVPEGSYAPAGYAAPDAPGYAAPEAPAYAAEPEAPRDTSTEPVAAAPAAEPPRAEQPHAAEAARLAAPQPPGEGRWPPPASGFGSPDDEATSGFGSRPDAPVPQPRHAAHDQNGTPIDPWNQPGDDPRTRDRAERVADHDRAMRAADEERTRADGTPPEPGDSPWAAPPRSPE